MNVFRRVERKIKSYGWKMPKGSIEHDFSRLNHIAEDKCYFQATEVSENREVLQRFEKGKIIAHTYWHGELGRKQIISLKSFLATQNLELVELWLWLDGESGYDNYRENALLQPLLPYITVKRYNAEQEIQRTPFRRAASMATQDHNLAARADAFRILMMHKYGGLYFDMDILFLRDLQTLFWGQEFVYAWEKQPYANSALMYFRKGSYITEHIVQKAVKRQSCLPWVLFRYGDKIMRYLRVYPCSFFDPLWMGYAEGMPLTRFEDLFCDMDKVICQHVNSFKDFFPGSYTFHWHNLWNREIHENSYISLFEREYDQIIGMWAER